MPAPAISAIALGQRNPGHEAEFGRAARFAWIDEQQARVEIADGRLPDPPDPAAARALPVGDDPQLARLAVARQRERVRVGRADLGPVEEPIASIARRSRKHAQNKEWAAAVAASTTGTG